MKRTIFLLLVVCIYGLIIAIAPISSQLKSFTANFNLTSQKKVTDVIKSATSFTVPVYTAKATQCQPGQELGNATDGLLNTIYHSDWKGSTLPDTLDFMFVDVAQIDSMIYYPRTSGGSNGNFGRTEIWYSTTANPQTFIKLMDKDFGQSATVSKVALNGTVGILNPATIRVVVKSGYGNFASCAEMVFKTIVPPVVEYDPASEVVMDTKQPVTSATASNFQSGTSGEGPITYSFDGDYSTIYHSSWSGGGFPITLDYNFSNVDKIDYLIYHPRSGGGNGAFQATEIWYSTTETPGTFIKACDYNFQASSSSAKVNLLNPVVSPKTVRIIVKSGYNNFASCAEMEFYKTSGNLNTPPENIFSDAICSGLKQNVSQADIDALSAGVYKSMAQCMLNGTYDTEARTQSYEPIPNVSTTCASLKTNGFSTFENPTGIYFEGASPAVVSVENTFGQNISLKVYDFINRSTTTYKLETGINKLSISNKGLAYVDYYTDNYASLQPVRIHICGGKVNGVYDVHKTTDKEWVSRLAHSPAGFMDLKGDKINMFFVVSGLKQYSPFSAKELVQFWDSVVGTQYRLMGLYKYNRIPKNRMYAEATDRDGSWHGGGSAHYGGGLDNTCSATNAKAGPWGIAHELGHVNTVGGMRWVSTTEVMNNIYSAWTEYLFASHDNLRLEKETINDAYYNGEQTGDGKGKGNQMIGGRFNSYLNNGILKGDQWLCQYGPDAMGKPVAEWSCGNTDHFVKLSPLWQLELYYQVVHPEKKDWYGDMCEKIRRTNVSGWSQGQLMVNFMKNACDAVQEDLTDFFRKTGMLRTFNKYMNDYGSAQLTITPADSTEVVAYANKYPKPESPVIYYLSANSTDAYKNKLPVIGTAGAGCVLNNSSPDEYKQFVTVDNAVWKNVAVFETYKDNKLSRISMVNSGYKSNDKTRVYYPSGSTSIYAVGWDGIRKLVYGSPIMNTGLNSVTLNGIVIFPNPASNSFQVSGLPATAILEITHMNGTVKHTQIINNQECVYLNKFTKGVYLIKITCEKGSFTQKLIKD